MVKLNAPAWSTVPERSPALESVSPFGSAPDETANVNGPGLPEAERVWLYEVPVAPPGRVVGESVIVEPEMLTVVAAPAFIATAPLLQSRAATDCTVIAPVPVGPTAATSSVNSEPPFGSPHGAPSSTRSTV